MGKKRGQKVCRQDQRLGGKTWEERGGMSTYWKKMMVKGMDDWRDGTKREGGHQAWTNGWQRGKRQTEGHLNLCWEHRRIPWYNWHQWGWRGLQRIFASEPTVAASFLKHYSVCVRVCERTKNVPVSVSFCTYYTMQQVNTDRQHSRTRIPVHCTKTYCFKLHH